MAHIRENKRGWLAILSFHPALEGPSTANLLQRKWTFTFSRGCPAPDSVEQYGLELHPLHVRST
jgi:hypothetical protein